MYSPLHYSLPNQQDKAVKTEEPQLETHALKLKSRLLTNDIRLYTSLWRAEGIVQTTRCTEIYLENRARLAFIRKLLSV